VMLRELLDRRAEVRARLGIERPEDLLEAGRVLSGLLEMLGDRQGEPLALYLAVQLREHFERERTLDPEQLAEELEEEVPRVAQRRRDAGSFRRAAGGAETRLVFSRPARRSASAMITSAGFAAPSVGKTLPSHTNRLGHSHAR
jgi:hypothetical protein